MVPSTIQQSTILVQRYADEIISFCINNDTEVITPEWLENMMGYCQRKDVGIVGAKLLYPDNTVQHAGVVVGNAGFCRTYSYRI